jgi:hypothetical protein
VADDPWTNDDPAPGNFDEELSSIDPRFVERHAGDRNARLRLAIRATGERVVNEHTDALKRLADDGPGGDV